MRLKGKTALIAGVGRNIGKAIALTFAKEGADLVLVDKIEDGLAQTADECASHGVQTLHVVADLGKYDEANRAVEATIGRFAKVDVLMGVAGIRPHKPIWEFDYDEWHQAFNVNLHSTFYLAKAIIPGMIKRRSGSIVALGGKVSLTSEPNCGAHTAAKHGLYGLIKALAQDLGPYGIRANLLIPSFIENVRVNPELYTRYGDPNNNARLANTPLGRIGTAQEAANVALFLASDESSYVTGDRIVCAGGGYM